MPEPKFPSKAYRIYKGNKENLDNIMALPLTNDPVGYQASEALIDAVNVAILLGKPLLITGEPGTGKTQLAYSIAHDLGLGELQEGRYKPFSFTAKHNSLAKDILYTYNSLQHFSDANQAKAEGKSLDRHINTYITYQALGKAIQAADPAWASAKGLEPKRSVVLIDEIDKAPLEFCNDLLGELEDMYFDVPEVVVKDEKGDRGNLKFEADKLLRPIVIITSNEEKLLPDAFLRRCAFFHIEFPSREKLKEILKLRLNSDESSLRFSEDQLDFLLEHFHEIRELCQKKKPSTADLIAWVQVLDHYKNFDIDKLKNTLTLTPGERHMLMMSYSVLAKHKLDFTRLKEHQ